MKQSYVLGIDIGGTNTVLGVIDARGNILASDTLPTRKYGNIDDYITEVARLADRLCENVGGKHCFRGVGVGAPNGNYFTGSIDFAPNLPWPGKLMLADMLRARIGLPVALTNDANAAAIGEMTYGAARGMQDFIVLTLGTGVGSGIVINGRLVYGNDGCAGELGHVIVKPDGRRCGCGRNGCLETYTSAMGVAHTACEYLRQNPDEPTLLRAHSPEEITSKDVFDAANAGDKAAIQIFEETGRILGEACANFVTFSGPEAIILFGGLTKAGKLILDPVKKHMEENLLKIYKGRVKLVFSELNESDAAVLGAGALGWEAK